MFIFLRGSLGVMSLNKEHISWFARAKWVVWDSSFFGGDSWDDNENTSNAPRQQRRICLHFIRLTFLEAPATYHSFSFEACHNQQKHHHPQPSLSPTQKTPTRTYRDQFPHIKVDLMTHCWQRTSDSTGIAGLTQNRWWGEFWGNIWRFWYNLTPEFRFLRKPTMGPTTIGEIIQGGAAPSDVCWFVNPTK